MGWVAGIASIIPSIFGYADQFITRPDEAREHERAMKELENELAQYQTGIRTAEARTEAITTAVVGFGGITILGLIIWLVFG